MAPKRFDIRNHARRLSGAVEGALDFVRARRQALDDRGRQGEPLVVIAGEQHDKVSHHLFHILFLDRLARGEDVAAGLEQPHDLLAKATGLRNDAIARKDRSEMTLHAALSARDPYDYADNAQRLIFAHLLDARLQTSFNDVAVESAFGMGYLDTRDNATREALRHVIGAAPAGVDGGKLDGMRVRNHFMAARAGGARVDYYMMGLAHAVGDTMDPTVPPPDESVPAAVMERGLPVAVIALADGTMAGRLPRRHGLGALHRVTGLPAPVAWYGSVEDGASDFADVWDEAVYDAAVLSAAGYAPPWSDLPGRNSRRHQSARVLDAYARHMAPGGRRFRG